MKGMDEILLAAENPIGKKQRRPFFKRKRSGEVLTREQVAAIKLGRKLLRQELRAQGIRDKNDFELTATSMGLYFDKSKFLALFWWFGNGRGLWALLGAAAALLSVLWLYSSVTEMRGHFTINMDGDMFREGFVLSETVGFENPTTYLFAEPAVDVPNISINDLPDNIDKIDGQHNANYFAYTFYVRNEGESTVDYDWVLQLNSESLNLSSAAWVMLFQDGKQMFFSRPNNVTGQPEALPAYNENNRGYIRAPMLEFSAVPDEQYEIIAQKNQLTFYRVIPKPFESSSVVTSGCQLQVDPMEVHKYTVVIWLEGDDPDCTNELIGGHVGVEMNFKLRQDEESAGEKGFWDFLYD